MDLPFWELDDVFAEVMASYDSWTHSTHVLFKEASFLVENIFSRLAHVKALQCGSSANTINRVCQMVLPNARNLTQLQFTLSLLDDSVNELSEALLFVPQLQQLSVTLESSDAESIRMLFERIVSLPKLWALDINIYCDSPLYELPLANAIGRMHRTLKAFDLFLGDSHFPELVCEALNSNPTHSLRRLRIFGCRFAATRVPVEKFVGALHKMPELRDLRLHVEEGSISWFTEAIEMASQSSLQHLQKLTTDVRGEFIAEDCYPLLCALKSLRLSSLSFSAGSDVDCASQMLRSELLDVGWIESVNQAFSSAEIEQLCTRNKRRHDACFKACVALLAVRKRRAALTAFPMEIVRNIAEYLWKDLRAARAWDDKN